MMLKIEELSSSDRVRLLGIVCSYILPKYKATNALDLNKESDSDITIRIIDSNGEVIK